MSLFNWIAAGIVSKLIFDIHESNKEYAENERKRIEQEKRRKNTPCQYNENISQYDFEQIVFTSIKLIKKRKINVSINNAIIYGTVTSQSGISTWNFELDFNDWGELTGNYHLSADNSDSVIPNRLAELISQEIKSRLS